MRKLNRMAALDFTWTVGAAVVTVVLGLLFHGLDLFNESLDLHLHDTYVVVPGWSFLLCLYLLVLFIAFFYKSSKLTWRTETSFLTVLFCGVLLTLLLTGIVAMSRIVFRGGWTIYPPLSGLGRDEFDPGIPLFLLGLLAFVVVSLQLLVMVLTIRMAIRYAEFRALRTSNKF